KASTERSVTDCVCAWMSRTDCAPGRLQSFVCREGRALYVTGQSEREDSQLPNEAFPSARLQIFTSFTRFMLKKRSTRGETCLQQSGSKGSDTPELQPGSMSTLRQELKYGFQGFILKAVEVTVTDGVVVRNSVRLVIRKVQYAPEKPGPQPMVETTRSFLMSDRSLHLEASLDKELYYHGEPISVNVHVTNNSTKTVKRVKISVRQYADICLFSTAQYKCPVAQLEADDQVSSSSTFCKVYTLTPTLDKNREKRGLALDGKLKHEDTNLASSTIVKDVTNKEVLGILVSYRVKVKLVVSRGGDVSVELPFILMHPKPAELPASRPHSAVPESDPPLDTNLIEFDTNISQDDDFVFEDFARLRLKGAVDDKEEDC
uniref:Arrestin beta 2 n=1 Tax=Nothobranchius furzeri TaxID=105023 RepID=A0A8C6KZA2_NOTFU